MKGEEIGLQQDRTSLNWERFGFVMKTLLGNRLVLCYQGNTRDLAVAMDDEVAIRWWDVVCEHEDIKMVNIKTKFFGQTQENVLPVIKDTVKLDDIEDITDEFVRFLVNKAQTGEMNDALRQMWFMFLKYYRLVIYDDVIVFKQHKETTKTGKIEKKKEEDEIMTTLMKEWMDGYFRFKDYEVVKSVYIQIGSKYKIDDEYGYLFGAYTPSLRWAMFANKTSFNKTDKFIKTYQTRQYIATKKLGWITFVACPRRGGKTRWLGSIGVREIVREATATHERGRPIRVLYIGLSDKKNKAPRDYILRMSQKYRATKMFKRQNEENRLSFVDQEGNVLGVIDFIGAKDYEAGVGEYADLILIDEAARIKESVYEAILPIVTNEGARLICVSTIDRRTKKNRFYRELIKGEKEEFLRGDIDERIRKKWKEYGLDKKRNKSDFTLEECAKIRKDLMYERELVGIRFTIDDIEYLSERDREFAKRKLQEYPQRYYAELYSIFPEEGKIFQYERVIKDSEKLNNITYDYIVLGYDPAVKVDNGAVVVAGYSKIYNKIFILEEINMPRDNYSEHANILNELKDKRRFSLTDGDIKNIYLVVDITGNLGLVDLLESKGCNIDLKIRYHSGKNITRDKDGTHKVAKEYLVDTLKFIIDNDGCVISNTCTNLLQEMNFFQVKENPVTGKQTYEAIEGHDDYVNATMIASYFIYDYMAEKDIIIKSNSIEQQQTRGLTFQEVIELLQSKEKKGISNMYDNMDRFLEKFLY